MKGVVYGLFASDEPLQIRYVGQTTRKLKERLRTHRLRGSWEIRKWTKLAAARGAAVNARVLGEYPAHLLATAEQKWISFWSTYCDLLNSKKSFKT